jgi:hypothetical protein
MDLSRRNIKENERSFSRYARLCWGVKRFAVRLIGLSELG